MVTSGKAEFSIHLKTNRTQEARKNYTRQEGKVLMNTFFLTFLKKWRFTFLNVDVLNTQCNTTLNA